MLAFKIILLMGSVNCCGAEQEDLTASRKKNTLVSTLAPVAPVAKPKIEIV